MFSYDIDSDSAQLSDHDFLGRCECELAEIVAAPEGELHLRVKLVFFISRIFGFLIILKNLEKIDILYIC